MKARTQAALIAVLAVVVLLAFMVDRASGQLVQGVRVCMPNPIAELGAPKWIEKTVPVSELPAVLEAGGYRGSCLVAKPKPKKKTAGPTVAGYGGRPAQADPDLVDSGALPFTGVPVVPLVLLAVAGVVAGVRLRRRGAS